MNIEAIKQLRQTHEVQGLDGNWNSSPYMLGLYNGLELALSIMEDRDPKYKDHQAMTSAEESSGSFVSWNNTMCNPLSPAMEQAKSAWEDGYKSGKAVKSEWQGLTDEEYTELWGKKPDLLNFFRKIEAKLKEKNA